MSNNKLEHTRDNDLRKLDVEERAEKAYECYNYYTRGKNYTEIAKLADISITAVKKLIKEHAVVVEKYRPETRTVAESQYRSLIDYYWTILEKAEDPDARIPALVWSKAMEGLVQAQTRLDKFYGHESPQLHVHGDMKTAADLIRDAQNSGHNVDQDELMNYAEEEIVDIEEED